MSKPTMMSERDAKRDYDPAFPGRIRGTEWHQPSEEGWRAARPERSNRSWQGMTVDHFLSGNQLRL